MPWKRLNPTDLEREYSPSSCVDDIQVYIDAYIQQSKAAEDQCGVLKDLRFGQHPDEMLDLFPSNSPNAPLVAFIHGGYWQQLSKDESTFAGPGFVDNGVAYAAINYTIAPAGTMEQMVDQCVAAVVWLSENAEEYGIARERIVLAGHSAGAHLAAMVMLRLRNAYPQHPVKCGILISGVFDLRPLLHTYVNEPLGLDEERAMALSPQLMDLTGLPPTMVCWGENETNEFKRQSREFAAAHQAAGGTSQHFEVAGCNHFDIIQTMNDPDSVLGGAITKAYN